MTIQKYTPASPVPGRTIIKIFRVVDELSCICLYYDIGVGPAAGYAQYLYQSTGVWPLCWRITKANSGDWVYKCAMEAISFFDPAITGLEDAAGAILAVDLNYADDTHTTIKVCRSYPVHRYKLCPDDIRLNSDTSWAVGSPEYMRANILAACSGFPVILTDYREKESPMIDWSAGHGIVLLPTHMPAGDYCWFGGKTTVDRKANLLELYNDFVVPENRIRYENAAIIAAAHSLDLVYVIATTPEDSVTKVSDLLTWSGEIPGKGKLAMGEKLYKQLFRYQRTYPNTSFVFCDATTLCDTIVKHLKI